MSLAQARQWGSLLPLFQLGLLDLEWGAFENLQGGAVGIGEGRGAHWEGQVLYLHLHV